MQNFQDTFEKRKRSFTSAFSILHLHKVLLKIRHWGNSLRLVCKKTLILLKTLTA